MASFHDRNVVAVDLLRQGHYLQARQLWCAALTELTASVANEEEDPAPDQHPNQQQPNTPLISTITLDDVLVTDTRGDTVFSMYKKVFLLMANDASHSIQALVLFYNLAATYHALGLQTGKSQLLQQAVRLYSKAEFILNSDIPLGIQHEIAVLKMATYNNMGHIFSLMLNVPAATVALEQLHTVVSRRMQQHEEQQRQDQQMGNLVSFVESLEFKFFIEPILMCGNLRLTMAPAA